jgi:predicted nucleic acid-binding protein
VSEPTLLAAAVVALLTSPPTLAWALTRAHYLGRTEDLRAQLDARVRDLRTADAVIKAAERAGRIQADHSRGRHAR